MSTIGVCLKLGRYNNNCVDRSLDGSWVNIAASNDIVQLLESFDVGDGLSRTLFALGNNRCTDRLISDVLKTFTHDNSYTFE